jgi:hypothetical protein
MFARPYTYLSALSPRLAARRGTQRAIMAMAHAIMVSVLPRLARQEPYRELGANSVDERRQQCTADRLTRRIAHLGYRGISNRWPGPRCKKFWLSRNCRGI